MPRFFYTVRDSTGKKIVSYEDAASEDELVSRLQDKGLVVIQVVSGQGDVQQASSRILGRVRLRHYHSRVSAGDMVLFCRQLATLLGAGVTLLKCLEVISKQVASVRLYEIIKDLQKNMEAGLSLHEAMAKHPKVFSELWINLVESGEASGNLAVVLGRLAGYLERDKEFRRKVISALIYPAILTVVGLSAFIFLTVRVMPTFAELFTQFGVKLPALTQALINFSNLLRHYWFWLIGGLGIGVYFFIKYVQTKSGKRHFEAFLFKLPVFGNFFQALAVERFTAEMSTLIESGVPILYSLEITEHSVGSPILSEIINRVKTEVRDGKTLSQPMEQSGFFEPMVLQMVAVGEEIGELPQMLKKINAFYVEYTEMFLARFTVMFEPIMLVVMGFLVGIMVVGMFLPIFDLSKIGSAAMQ